MSYIKIFNDFIEKIKRDKSNINIEKLSEAFALASEAHLGQYRKSGEDYIIHPLEVTMILYDLKMDTDTLVAGLLHDVVEDTLVTIGDIEYNFGKDVAKLVDGVTKLRNLPRSQGKQLENIRKMVIAMSQDIRVVVIKLADRIHNMRTLEFQSYEKQIEKSKESLEIFAPIAHRIGMSKLKSELEDISFKYLEPDEYQKIKKYVSAKKVVREKLIKIIIEYLTKKLNENGIKNFTITGRPKHLYSIFKKMNDKAKEFVELTDLLAVRILTEKESDCYAVLGIVHSCFTPLIDRFKDYISVPKANGYKSIHTTVIFPKEFTGDDTQNLEIQIRTYEMHDIAENGVAAHWKYKERKSIDKNEAFYAEAKKLVAQTKQGNNFVQEVTEKVLSETIFVLTPKNEVREISKNATVLDFAFLIHTQIGYKTIGAKINDKIVTLDTVLKNGDKVEILTSNNIKGPSKDWLNIVKLNSTKVKIKKWFNDKEFEEKSQLGISQLEKEFAKIDIKFKDIVEDPKLLLFLKKYNLNTIEQLAFKINEGSIQIKNLLNKFVEEKKITIDEIIEKNVEHKEDNQSGITINGTNNTSIIISKCCHPFPGDNIKSYVKNGKGIVVHKENCLNLLNVLMHNPDREIEVHWSKEAINNNKQKYQYHFKVKAVNKTGILLDIVKVINDLKIDINNVNSINKSNYVIIDFIILLKNKDEYSRLEKALNKLNVEITS